jgi:predicted negative regulator of RcsB-dependent stress response
MAIQRTTNSSILRTISDAIHAQSNLITAVIAAFVVMIVLFFGHKLWVVKRERAAQYDFSSLMTEYETMSHDKNPEWSSLLEKFETTYEKHASSSLLPYYLGYKVRILLNQAKKEEALATLNTMITEMPGSPILALYQMERALILLDSSDEAIRTTGLQALKTLAQDGHNEFRDSAQFYLGRYYWAMNDVDSARQIWQQLVDEQRDEKMSPSPWVNYVQDKLTLTIV